ncbi:MAG: hypothetical protein ACTSPD_03400 [Promethearchaeota archaeon]
MIGHQLFNLEKIKEISSPINKLQGKIYTLEDLYEKVIEYKDFKKKKIFDDEAFLNKLHKIFNYLGELVNDIIKISKANVDKFFTFQDHLIEKYKENFRKELLELNLNKDYSKKIGLFLIENKKISKIVKRTSFIFSIPIEEYIAIFDSLNENSLFLATLKKVHNFYQNLIKKKLDFELKKIPLDTDPILIKDFKTIFLKNPLTFEEFLFDFEKTLSKEDLKIKRKIIEKFKEKKNIEKLKNQQEKQLKIHGVQFEDYIKLTDEEFRRKRRKEKREKLSDLIKKPNVRPEISEKISEKIEKFKSKVSFEKKYLISKDNEKDPLDLIREIKKKREEEYKKFLKKFKKE